MVKYFLRFVEIKTKLASLLPFLFTITLLLFYNIEINWLIMLIFFIGMIFFDMATTAMNSYYAIRKEKNYTDADYKMIMKMKELKITQKTNLNIVAFLLTIATIFGLVLFFLTNIWVLFLGIACFGVGIFYSFGPLPICRTPFGEIFSGLTMGFLIPLIIFVAQDYQIISLQNFDVIIYIIPILKIFMATLPITIAIANIMLANNITDLEKDFINKRYTLAVYLGRDQAEQLLISLYGLLFVIVVFDVFLGVISSLNILLIIISPVVIKNAKKVITENDESYSVKNFLMIMLGLIVFSAMNLVWG